MSNTPLMPMATAVWLVENTTLTFKQIADFCKLHEVEVQGIADGDVGKGIVGYNPIIAGQLTRDEIDNSSKDQNRPLQINTYDYVIHFGNFGFKTNIKSYTLIQNILPLVRPFSSLKNFVLNILYKYTFRISDEIIVQQEHVAKLIPKQYITKIIGSIEIKNIKQSNNLGFVTIYEENKNKNPKFQKELLREISSKYDEKITVVNLSTNNEIYNNNFFILQDLSRNESIEVFKQHSTYIHTSEFETVGLPIYEALESGLNVVIPNLDYVDLTNENIFKYEFGNYASAINACNESIKNLDKEYCNVPIYYENWNLE